MYFSTVYDLYCGVRSYDTPVMCEVSEECICVFSCAEDGARVFLQTLTLNYQPVS